MIQTGLMNFYGEVISYTEDGKYYLALDNYDRLRKIEISEQLYIAIQKEFGGE